MEGRHTVLVVDDHPLFRKGVVQLLAMEPSIEVMQDGIQKVLQGLTTHKEVKAVAIK